MHESSFPFKIGILDYVLQLESVPMNSDDDDDDDIKINWNIGYFETDTDFYIYN